jgi:hypothetical protein
MKKSLTERRKIFLPLLFSGFILFPGIVHSIKPAQWNSLTMGINPIECELDLKKQIILTKGEAWQEFLAHYPNWTVIWNEGTETPHRAVGSPIQLTNTPNEEVTRRFILENPNLFKVDEKDLRLLRGEKHGKLWYFTFQETYRGIPVINGRVDLRLDSRGRLAMLGADTHPDIQLSTSPSVAVDKAIENAKDRVNYNPARDQVTGSRLVILPAKSGVDYHLAWEIRLNTNDPLGRWVALVDAETGELLVLYNRIRTQSPTTSQTDTIFGSVTGLIHPLYGTDPLSVQPFKDERIHSRGYGGNTGITDSLGDYLIPVLGSNPRNIMAYLVGPYVFVTNNGGNEANYFGSATPGIPHDFLWDTTLAIHSERDVFYHTIIAHDRLKKIDPGYNFLDYPVPGRVNLSGLANAFWDGYGMAFGDGGAGSGDFGEFADVVYHEYGHGITDYQYRPFGTSGAMHEGYSDFYACTITDEPLLGEGIIGGRNLDNDLLCPENLQGESHADGRIIGGALWHMREGLADVPLAESLAHYSRYGFPGSPFQNECKNFFDYLLEIYLVDDDDADLSNGTPHGVIIGNAFKRHGIGPELELEDISALDVSPLPDIVFDPGDTVEIVVTIRLTKHLLIPATNVTGVLSTDPV